MVFSYAVYATGHGFATFFAHFKNDRLLSLAQIEFIVHCQMKDAPAFWSDGPPMIITSVKIASV